MRKLILTVIAAWTLLTGNASATIHEPFPVPSSKIVVSDGDTFKLGKERYRLWGIDAPEKHQECLKAKVEIKCGYAAKLALIAIVKTGDLVCNVIQRDRYQRNVVKCTADGLDIGKLMVMSGWALDYNHYSKGLYAVDEKLAMQSKRGLWATCFTKPWDWRKGNRDYHAVGEH